MAGILTLPLDQLFWVRDLARDTVVSFAAARAGVT